MLVQLGSPSSTTVDQDAPSTSNSHTTQETQTPIISHNVEEDNHDIEVSHIGRYFVNTEWSITGGYSSLKLCREKNLNFYQQAGYAKVLRETLKSCLDDVDE
ncbi:hypothetical protein Tco_0530559 [Tanacetum coccineum]